MPSWIPSPRLKAPAQVSPNHGQNPRILGYRLDEKRPKNLVRFHMHINLSNCENVTLKDSSVPGSKRKRYEAARGGYARTVALR